ncbi:hypothetical protein [Caballeronia telluris]|uniref:hypothetical protein n=1 Tax=Caballeronia telluris TaxID=326475 RepID=UPI000B3EACD8|nr:hypothetical protein [Caballeronia telluris]
MLAFEDTEVGRALFSVAQSLQQIYSVAKGGDEAAPCLAQIEALAEASFASVEKLVNHFNTHRAALEDTRDSLLASLERLGEMQDVVLEAQEHAVAVQRQAKASLNDLASQVAPARNVIY